MSDRPEWFAPKRYGMGAGLPIAWQGWVVVALYAAAAALCVAIFGGHDRVTIAIMLPLTAILVLITLKTTRGGWRWRWGEED
jgi:hypothetical protein